MSTATSDQAVAEVLRVCRLIGVRLHVRGTDTHPVIELRERRTGAVVGGTEVRRRLAREGIVIDVAALTGSNA